MQEARDGEKSVMADKALETLKKLGEDLETHWEAYREVRFPGDNPQHRIARLLSKEAWVSGGLAALAVLDKALDELDEGDGSVCIDDILDRLTAHYSQETTRLTVQHKHCVDDLTGEDGS